MQLKFNLNEDNEAYFTDSLTDDEFRSFEKMLKIADIVKFKHSELSDEGFIAHSELLKSVIEDAERINFTQPDCLMANYVISEYKFVHTTLEEAFKINQLGMKAALKVVPKDFTGRLVYEMPYNMEFYLLVDQLIDIIQAYIASNMQRDFADDEPDDNWPYWFGEEKYRDDVKGKNDYEIDNKFTAMIDDDFNSTVQLFIDAMESLGDLVSNKEKVIHQSIATLYALLSKYDKAEEILEKVDTTLPSLLTRAAVCIMAEKYDYALYYFRQGLLINPHFGESLHELDDKGSFYQEHPQASREAADHYLEDWMGGLWWQWQVKSFGQWASGHSLVLADAAARMQWIETALRKGKPTNNDMKEYLMSYQGSISLKDCAEAVKDIVDSDGDVIPPWWNDGTGDGDNEFFTSALTEDLMEVFLKSSAGKKRGK